MRLPLQKRFWRILGIGGGGFFILLVATVFIGGDIRTRAERIQSIRNNIHIQTETIQTLANLKQQSEKAMPRLSFLEDMIPLPEQIFAVPREFKSAATAAGVELTFQFGDEHERSATELGYTTFTVSAKGSLPNISRFLRNVLKGQFITLIEGIDVSRLGQEYTSSFRGKVITR